MTREEAYRLAMRACEETWNEKICKQIKEALEKEPKTGHWIHRKMDNECWEECSECHVERAYPTLYCPDCGCRMFKPQENCNTCKHKDGEWDSEPCDGCCGANSKWSGEIYPGEFESMEHNGRMDACMSEEISREEIAALLARGSE